MPNRIIKESIRTSETIDKLSPFEETLFYRLIVSCDDYGRFDGRASIVKGSCFPLKDGITRKNIEDALEKLASVGLVNLYEVDGKPFLLLPSWSKHQNIRAKKSKYPEPDKEMMSFAYKCMQMPTNVPVIQSNPNPIRIQSESNKTICPEQTPVSPVRMAECESIPLNDGSEWKPTADQYDEWLRLYPGVDLQTEFRKMRSWSNSNPRNKKTPKGVTRFVNGWLDRAQNSAIRRSAKSPEEDPF